MTRNCDSNRDVLQASGIACFKTTPLTAMNPSEAGKTHISGSMSKLPDN